MRVLSEEGVYHKCLRNTILHWNAYERDTFCIKKRYIILQGLELIWGGASRPIILFSTPLGKKYMLVADTTGGPGSKNDLVT